ncbi:MAG TPA: hypothetical protein V6D29_07340 [Leptolyngbyaceae cyanobacterium]
MPTIFVMVDMTEFSAVIALEHYSLAVWPFLSGVNNNSTCEIPDPVWVTGKAKAKN